MTKDEQQALDVEWDRIEKDIYYRIVGDPYRGFWLGWKAHQEYVAKSIDTFLHQK